MGNRCVARVWNITCERGVGFAISKFISVKTVILFRYGGGISAFVGSYQNLKF